jgi:hypothetical protein
MGDGLIIAGEGWWGFGDKRLAALRSPQDEWNKEDEAAAAAC